MPITKLATDFFGVVTISLVSLTAILGLLCICFSLYFHIRIQGRGFPQLGYFNGPWITRITLILLVVLWGFGEIVRSTVVRRKTDPFSSSVCKLYILSNLGFTEPSMFLLIVFMLHASLQKRESGALSQKWNIRTIGTLLLFCLPLLIMQLVLVLAGPKFDSSSKMVKILTSTNSSTEGIHICIYPLMSTIILGLFSVLLVGYLACIGTRMLYLVINKGLRRRVRLLVFSVVGFFPLRVLLLGFSVLLTPGGVAFESTVFLAFSMSIFCAMVGICMLVYFPVADSLALRDIKYVQIEEVHSEDCYSEGASLVINPSHQLTARNSDVSVKMVPLLFHTSSSDLVAEVGSYTHIVSCAGSSPLLALDIS